MYEFLRYCVKDAMTTEPITVGPDAQLFELEHLFDSHEFNGAPVVDENRHLLGVVTKLDLLKAFAFHPGAIIPHYSEIMKQTVTSVMVSEPVTVDPELPLSRLLHKMVELRTKSFPVVKDAQLVGIVAREDVLRALRRATAGEVQQP
jgi:CBS domain-containing protein